MQFSLGPFSWDIYEHALCDSAETLVIGCIFIRRCIYNNVMDCRDAVSLENLNTFCNERCLDSKMDVMISSHIIAEAW